MIVKTDESKNKLMKAKNKVRLTALPTPFERVHDWTIREFWKLIHHPDSNLRKAFNDFCALEDHKALAKIQRGRFVYYK